MRAMRASAICPAIAERSVDPNAAAVFAGEVLGDASRISDSIGAGGGRNDTGRNDALPKLWPALGFKRHCFEGLQQEHQHAPPR
jgi:hypothetical protein